MARLRSLEKSTQDVKVHPTEVDCFHQVITAADGTRLLHITTFGSDQRRSDPKSSQSLQIDEARACELIGIIQTAFPGPNREGGAS